MNLNFLCLLICVSPYLCEDTINELEVEENVSDKKSTTINYGGVLSKENNINFVQPAITSYDPEITTEPDIGTGVTTDGTTVKRSTNTGVLTPVRVTIPLLSRIPITKPTKKIAKTEKHGTKDQYKCPKSNTIPFTLLPLVCTDDSNCRRHGIEFLCCDASPIKQCVKGKKILPKKAIESKHEPILGLIPRTCPRAPLAELWFGVQECKTDKDCWPRICCPDGTKMYCRTSNPSFDNLPSPIIQRIIYPFEVASGYLQCTPPPNKRDDPHPKVCNNSIDCFPNVCCQEKGKKHCRPPQRSLLTLVTTFAQQFNRGPIRQWSENLVIK